YLETFINYERKPDFQYKTTFKLERMKRFLSLLHDPQENKVVIHIAGTKGKGSTACFVAHILKEAGFRVGLYTSPHLIDFRERIRILDLKNTAEEKSLFQGMILKNDFSAVLDGLKPVIDYFGSNEKNYGDLTFFEILTAMALEYFREKNADIIVLETGLGGRFDATNAVDSSVSVITPISYDHERILGDTLPEIAFEKAGIIKSSNKKCGNGKSICVAALHSREIGDVIKRRAEGEGAFLFEFDKDFYYKKLGGDFFSQEFFYRGLNNGSFFLKTRMLGVHQLLNASLALAAVEALSLFDIRTGSAAFEKGIFNAYWPGRLEVVSTKPFIILDGAHNRDSTSRLVSFLDSEFKKYKKRLIFGACEDKDIKGIAEQLDNIADKVILTKADNPRAADPKEKLAPLFKKNKPLVTDSVEQAIDMLNKDISDDEVAIITGSLFVVGEARGIWQRSI
ncbi:MAG TPA: folylpolyglutamate synthase/dihydrofolate synthase family protein, partial [Candidatus Omnitrophota bacterium]|nr:folylpolyglutamate synthase/dihydrofolate synthase family protein [Candidatus Omnitrophota bacterium]